MKTVLILENESNLRTLYKDEGYHVHLAKDDREVLDYLKKRSPDLIITDYPVKQSKKYKALLQAKKAPVIVCANFPQYFFGYVRTGNVECLIKSSKLSILN
jgi:CheY-like chemotaxis protein